MRTILGISDNNLQQSSGTKRGCVGKNRLETSNCCWFWGPLEMVDMEPLSALNRGQTVDKVMFPRSGIKGNKKFSTMCQSFHHS